MGDRQDDRCRRAASGSSLAKMKAARKSTAAATGMSGFFSGKKGEDPPEQSAATLSPPPAATLEGPRDDVLDDASAGPSLDGNAALAALLGQFKERIVASGSVVRIDDDNFLSRFLSVAKGDLEKATVRHARYWEFRIGAFGSERALDAAVSERVSSEFPFFIVPPGVRSNSGCQIVIVRPRYLDWRRLTVEEALETVWYQLDRVLQERQTQQHGIFVINNTVGMTYANVNRAFLPRMAEGIQDCLPVRIGGIRLCNQPWFFSTLWAFMSVFLKEKTKSRIKLLGSDHAALLDECPKASIPRELGGELVLPD